MENLKDYISEYSEEHNLLVIEHMHDTNICALIFRISDLSKGEVKFPMDLKSGMTIQGVFLNLDLSRRGYFVKMFVTSCDGTLEDFKYKLGIMFGKITGYLVSEKDDFMPVVSFDGKSIAQKTKEFSEDIQSLPKFK